MRSCLVVLLAVAGILIPATSAQAQLLGGSLSISAPPSATLGSAPAGSPTLSGSLGSVQVADTRTLGLGWTATVSSTTFTGAGLSVIPNSSLTYVSGGVTATTGVVTPIPGDPLGVTLESQKTAFSASVGTLGGAVTWNPTITVALPPDALVGNYTGTITHSVS